MGLRCGGSQPYSLYRGHILGLCAEEAGRRGIQDRPSLYLNSRSSKILSYLEIEVVLIGYLKMLQAAELGCRSWAY